MPLLLRALATALVLACLALVPSAGPPVAADPLPPGTTVSGTITAADGGSLATTGFVVRLYSFDPEGAFYPTPQDSVLIPAGEPTTYSLEAPLPGYYAVQVRPLRGPSGPSPYLTGWYGGQGVPTSATDPGALFIAGDRTPISGADVELVRGVVVSGTVRGSDGGAVQGATVTPERWVDDDTVEAVPGVTDAISGTNGTWATTVPSNMPLTIRVTGRAGYAEWVLGGSRATRTTANTLVTTADATVDITLTPSWTDVGSNGAIVADESCLRSNLSGTATVGGRALHVSSKGVVSAGEPVGDPFAAGIAALVPYWTDTARSITWGVADDGSLCAVWRSSVDHVAVQLIARPADDGSLAVTYAYGTLGPNPYVTEAQAGWTDGIDAVVLDRPYDDDSGDGLVHRSLDSDVPGRYRFTFWGFLDPAATNTEAPTVTRSGSRLTADPGSWEVSGGDQADLDLTYEWLRGTAPIDGETGPTLDIDPTQGDAYAVRVTARRDGHRPVAATSEVLYVATGGYLSTITAPTVTGTPVAGATLTASPGTWRAGGVAPSASNRSGRAAGATFRYEWTVGGQVRSTTSTLALTPADVGQDIDLTVHATLAGHGTGSAYVRLGRVLPAGTAPRDLAVTVVDEGSDPVDAAVAACAVDTGVCRRAGAGPIVAGVVPGATYVVTATPPQGSGLRAFASEVTIPVDGPAALTITLRAPMALPDGVALDPDGDDRDGVPVLYWGEDRSFEVTGCAGIVGATATITFSDGTAAVTGDLAETVPGTYRGDLPPLADRRGYATVTTDVRPTCGAPDGLAFDVYVDPYGTVVDQYGRPVGDARLTLLRSETAAGPFAYVPDGDEAVIPGQSENPVDGGEEGWFYWLPTQGWYVIEAAAPGCATGATPPLPVEPYDVNVTVRLECTAPPPAPAEPLSVRGRPEVGGTLTAVGGDFGMPTDVHWLRGDRIVGTGPTYVVQSDDAGHELRARTTGVRPDAVPDPERGDPISFRPARALTSAPVAVPGPPVDPTDQPATGPDGDPGDPGSSGGPGGSGAAGTGGPTGPLARTGVSAVLLLLAAAALLLGGTTLRLRARR